jgi:hypothetical protein
MTIIQVIALACFIVGCIFMVINQSNLQSPTNWFLITLCVLALFGGVALLGGRIL